jgi:hypothetical protein
LANGLRGLMGKHQYHCSVKRIAPAVQLRELHCRKTGGKRLAIGGTAHCKSALCPLCVLAIARRRTEDIKQAIDVWGASRVWFVTLTTRHHRGMALELLHRLQTTANGNLFAGRAGQEFARDLGGPLVRSKPPAGSPNAEPAALRTQKPHTVRAHDRTWSERNGWHPHMHALWFVHVDIAEDRFRELLLRRWKLCAAKALMLLKETVHNALIAEQGTDTIPPLSAEQLVQLRKRCEKVLGKKLFRASRSLADNAEPLARALEAFCEQSIMPSDKHAVHVELARTPDKVASYLVKLGLELSGMGNKIGKVVKDDRGNVTTHYGLWQLATIACTHGDELRALRQRARAAWSDLYRATYGTQTLTFSQGARAAFGLDERLDADIEQEAPTVTEDERTIGNIEGIEWDAMAKHQRQGLLATLHNAHRLGVLELLPYVRKEPLPETAFMGRAVVREQEQRPDFVELQQRGEQRGRAPPEPETKEQDSPSLRLGMRWKRERAREKLRAWLVREGIDPPGKASNT